MSLALAAAVAVLTAQVPGPPEYDVDLSFATSFGSRVGLGGVAQATLRKQIWEVPSVGGSLGVGVLAGYQAEPYSFTAQYFPGTKLTGATHRFEALVVAGHDFRFFTSRRFLVAVQVFIGWMQVALRGSLSNPAVDVAGSAAANAGAFSTGAILRLGVRLTDRVSVLARAVGPFPYATAVTPYVLLTLGASVEL